MSFVLTRMKLKYVVEMAHPLWLAYLLIDSGLCQHSIVPPLVKGFTSWILSGCDASLQLFPSSSCYFMEVAAILAGMGQNLFCCTTYTFSLNISQFIMSSELRSQLVPSPVTVSTILRSDSSSTNNSKTHTVARPKIHCQWMDNSTNESAHPLP
jgi:hypothetical protein